MSQAKPMWAPDAERIENANITALRRAMENDWERDLPDTTALHRFSVDEPEKFYATLVRFAGVRGSGWDGPVLVDGHKLPGATWFPEVRFNIAENYLRRRDDAEAIVFRGEDKVRRRLTYAELYDAASRMAQALKQAGVGPGDRVAAYLPNMPEPIIAVLAAASLGATFSSCSPDFGVQGVLDRFGQVEPKVLFAVDGYHYNGKTHDVRGKVAEIAQHLPSLEHVVVAGYAEDAPDLGAIPHAVAWNDFLAGFEPGEIEFAQLPFDHPLYIVFSSGTTGAPKCMVHSAGGAILKHAVEQHVHCDMKPGDRIFFFTTCGWMMWNWLVSCLAWETTLLLYDGSPFYPSAATLFDYADEEKITLFGTSAKFIDALSNTNVRPADSHDLSSVTQLCSTGSTLVPEGFDFVYEHIKKDIHLVSFSGGTDIMGCFAGGDPTRPVWRGELQMPMLGMDVKVFDDEGRPVVGEKGELVCTNAFPSVPLGFLDDDDGRRFHDAYFDVYPNIWHHGDYVAETEHGGLIFYGRSDATLNPGGVRIGTAEIYRQVEKLDEVVESIVIGQDWDNDVRVVLFVVLRDEFVLTPELADRIKAQVRTNCTPRHVPAVVVQVADIPRTKSGKITELAVRDVVHGRAIKNKEALANPEALAFYEDLPQLKV